MTSIDPPSFRHWNERMRWFDDRLRRAAGDGPLRVDAQTEAILTELRRVFASGAWVTSVVLAQTVIDSDVANQLRAADPSDMDGGDGLHLNTVRFGRDYVWLRERRNAYVHNDTPLPAVTARDIALDGARLEREARKAVDLMADALAGVA